MRVVSSFLFIVLLLLNIKINASDYVYHASNKGDRKVITPYKYVFGQLVIYAAKNLPAAAIYITKWDCFDLYVGGKGTINEPLYIVERYPGAFNLFRKKSGYIYKLNGKNFYDNKANNIYVLSTVQEEIVDKIYIDDIWKVLNTPGANIKLFHYPDRPPIIPEDDSDLVEKAIEWHNLIDTKEELIKNFLKRHPKLSRSFYDHLKKDVANELIK